MSHPGPDDGREPNHLAGEASPYLRQHLYNPVDWYPWSPAAWDRAAREDKPVFVSIGYAACHWCHVMERESFEDPRVAAFLNEHFVSIKVDREERPDVDDVYMQSVQLMTGHGGWPLSVFLTPDARPFFGGTYFPPEDRHGMPGFLTLLERIHAAWVDRRPEVTGSAQRLTDHLRALAAAGAAAPATGDLWAGWAGRAAAELAGRFDDRWGGFGSAPKFPPETALAFLLRQHARSGEPVARHMVLATLAAMAAGGIYDHIGGGFCRYSTDERWMIPHFEKMLYNQALLVPVYLDAWLVAGSPDLRTVAEETLDFVRRELTSPEGGFYASLDADSEGHEGRFYVWSPGEIRDVLGEADAARFSSAYGMNAAPNFEGGSIPHRLGGGDAAGFAAARRELLSARALRVRPATDDKVLTAWNGLMITAYARAHQVLGRPDDLAAARGAADFVRQRLLIDGRLRAVWSGGAARLNAYLDDYAFVARAFVDLYETSFDPADLDTAAHLARTIVARFQDPTRGGLYFTSDDHETLLVRSTSRHDGALPSGAGVAAEVLLRLASHLDDARLRDAAVRILGAHGDEVARVPSAFPSHFVAADFLQGPVVQIAVVGGARDPATQALLRAAWGCYVPNRVVAAAEPGRGRPDLPLLAGKTPAGGAPTAWVCRDAVCEAPITDPAALARRLGLR
jgi:hypothetical protein